MIIDYGSVCSGIEAASVAWEPLGFKPSWFSEIEKFPSLVLAHHWPDVENHGDMTLISEKIKSGNCHAPLVLVGGTPCQAFSVAGLRKGLEDDRGKLTISYVNLLNEIDKKRISNGLGQCVAVWENVPGVLSSKDNAFGCFLGALAGENGPLIPSGSKWSNAGCVFGPQRAIAWRVLDAQYFGVPQRRRRVFVVASARAGFDPAKVLFEFEGVRRDIAPVRKTREEVTGTLGARASSGGGFSTDFECAGGLQVDQGFRMCAFGEYNGGENAIAFAENSRGELRLEGGDGTRAGCLSAGGGKAGQGTPMVVSVALRGREGGATAELGSEISGCLRASSGGGDKPHVLTEMKVRRLTPTECERLQGFPDGYTKINDKTPDGPRYKALGNSMAVPCMAWIGKRLKDLLIY